MTKHEYRILHIPRPDTSGRSDPDTENILNASGQAGWRVVCQLTMIDVLMTRPIEER